MPPMKKKLYSGTLEDDIVYISHWMLNDDAQFINPDGRVGENVGVLKR